MTETNNIVARGQIVVEGYDKGGDRAVDDVLKEILKELIADFDRRRLTLDDLTNGYLGIPMSTLGQGLIEQVSSVDLELAIKDLEEDHLVATGPLVAYDNPPNSELFFVGTYSKREYTYLTEKGYKMARRLGFRNRTPAQPPSIQQGVPLAEFKLHPAHNQSRSRIDSQLFDVFVSYASEDKDYVQPLVEALEAAGIRVWFDKTGLQWGDDLRTAIGRGLANCQYGIVIFSKAFLSKKKWTEYELNSLFAREQPGTKIILPIWHKINRNDLLQYGSALADRLAKISTNDSYSDIVQSLLGLLDRQIGEGLELSKGKSPTMAKSAGTKLNAIAYAWYETTGENAVKVKAFVRPSTERDEWFMFDNSLGEEQHGSKKDIAEKFVTFDKNLRLKHYIRMQHFSADPAFSL